MKHNWIKEDLDYRCNECGQRIMDLDKEWKVEECI